MKSDMFKKGYEIEMGGKREEIEFHLKTRMFYIDEKDELRIADENLPFSHIKWFKKIGLTKKEYDSLIKRCIRGFIDEHGNIIGYTGYDFRTDKRVEQEILKNICRIIEQSNLKADAKLYTGIKKESRVGKWDYNKSYGPVFLKQQIELSQND